MVEPWRCRVAPWNAFGAHVGIRFWEAICWLVVGEGDDAQDEVRNGSKNRLDDLAKKRKAEEDERKDAARFRQTVSAASEQLVEAFKNFTTPPAQAETVGALVEQKMATMKQQIMDEIGAKVEESNKEVKDTLTSILDLLRNRN